MVLLLFLPLLQDADRARQLVERLGSEVPDEREAAFEELAAMGPAIAGVLEEFREAADPEVRVRVAELLWRARRMTDRERWLPPVRRVSIQVRDAPVGEILALAAQQTGIRAQMPGVGLDRAVTLDLVDAPVVQLWDELERALGVPLDSYRTGMDPEDLAVNLQPRQGGGPRFVVVTDRFRVRLESFIVTETRQWTAAERPPVQRRAVMTIRLDAQPGTFPVAILGVADVKAVGEGGAALLDAPWLALSAPAAPTAEEDPQAAAFLGRGQDPLRHTQVPITVELPEVRPERVAEVRGEVVLAFPMTEQEFVLARERFGEAADFYFGRVLVRIEAVEATATSFSFRLRIGDDEGGVQLGHIFSSLAFLDAEGVEVPPRGSSASGNRDAAGLVYQLQYQLEGERVEGVRLRGFVGRYVVRVPFRFESVPVP